jgi:hypothetical protein
MRMLVVCCGLLLIAPISAQSPDVDRSWLQKPYDVRLIVHADPHPLLTNLFVEEFVRDLGDTLQHDLGQAARVHPEICNEKPDGTEYKDSALRLMQAVVQRGWTELDKGQPVGAAKIHLIRLIYSDGEYEVQSRQVDGDTAFVSPLRKTKTADRQWVTRLAALQVAQDFGLCGEITSINAQTIRIQLRAGGLGVPQTIRIGQGHIMALTRVNSNSNGIASTPITETLAFVTNVDAVRGEVTARVYSRLKEPFKKDKQTVDFRAIKLGTRVVPLQLRVVDTERNPLVGYSVSHFPGGYENAGSEPLGATDNQGQVTSRDPIHHVAFVQVDVAGVGRIDTPVPLLDDQPITIQIDNTKLAQTLTIAKFDFTRWLERAGRIQENFEVDWADVERLLKEGRSKEALEKANTILKQLTDDTQSLTTELNKIKQILSDPEAQKQKSVKDLITLGDSLLKRLTDSVKGIRDRVKEELNPSPERQLWIQAQKAQDEGDIDKALELMSQSLKLNANQPTLLKDYSKLKRHWQIRSGDADHQKARDFAVNVWNNKKRKLDWIEIAKELENAESYLTDLEQRKDYLTGFVLYYGNVKQVKTLNEALESVGRGSDDAIDKPALIEKTRRKLIDFNTRVWDFSTRVKAEREKEGN